MESFAARSLPAEESATRFPPHRLGDAQLVHAARLGDADAWVELWKRHANSVRRVLGACLGADPAVEDLLQEAFLALHRSLDRLEKPEAVRGFLMGTAARLSAFELRTRGRRFKWLRLTPTGTLPDLPLWEDHETPQTMRALARVLGHLSPELRSVFVLRYVEEMVPREIGKAMGYSESKAKRQVKRARDRVLRLSARDEALRPWVESESVIRFDASPSEGDANPEW